MKFDISFTTYGEEVRKRPGRKKRAKKISIVKKEKKVSDTNNKKKVNSDSDDDDDGETESDDDMDSDPDNGSDSEHQVDEPVLSNYLTIMAEREANPLPSPKAPPGPMSIDPIRWISIETEKEFDDLIESLRNRGRRERALLAGLRERRPAIIKAFNARNTKKNLKKNNSEVLNKQKNVGNLKETKKNRRKTCKKRKSYPKEYLSYATQLLTVCGHSLVSKLLEAKNKDPSKTWQFPSDSNEKSPKKLEIHLGVNRLRAELLDVENSLPASLVDAYGPIGTPEARQLWQDKVCSASNVETFVDLIVALELGVHRDQLKSFWKPSRKLQNIFIDLKEAEDFINKNAKDRRKYTKQIPTIEDSTSEAKPSLNSDVKLDTITPNDAKSSIVLSKLEEEAKKITDEKTSKLLETHTIYASLFEAIWSLDEAITYPKAKAISRSIGTNDRPTSSSRTTSTSSATGDDYGFSFEHVGNAADDYEGASWGNIEDIEPSYITTDGILNHIKNEMRKTEAWQITQRSSRAKDTTMLLKRKHVSNSKDDIEKQMNAKRPREESEEFSPKITKKIKTSVAK